VVVIAAGGLVGFPSSSPHREVASLCPSRASEVVAADYLKGAQQPIRDGALLHAGPGARELSTAVLGLLLGHRVVVLSFSDPPAKPGRNPADLLG
jgi:hypothetical protein